MSEETAGEEFGNLELLDEVIEALKQGDSVSAFETCRQMQAEDMLDWMANVEDMLEFRKGPEECKDAMECMQRLRQHLASQPDDFITIERTRKSNHVVLA